MRVSMWFLLAVACAGKTDGEGPDTPPTDDPADTDTDTDSKRAQTDTDSDTDTDTDTDTGLIDADNDGVTADLDCNDDDAGIFPGAIEVCDRADAGGPHPPER